MCTCKTIGRVIFVYNNTNSVSFTFDFHLKHSEMNNTFSK